MGSSHCGTYLIHPKQMAVDYPTNVDDADITAAGLYAKPLSVPTCTTFMIFRNSTAAVFREIVDAALDQGIELEELPYQTVLELDRKLSDIVEEWPTFFRLDTKSCKESRKFDKCHPFLRHQRDMGNFGFHVRLSRLHRPYLARGATLQQYAYSRMVCLRSARTVVEVGKSLLASQDFRPIKMWTVGHHIFVSTVILVMDYCFNREEPRAKERKEEIMGCFKLLENTQEYSTIAKQGLKRLRIFLNGHAEKPWIEPRVSDQPADSFHAGAFSTTRATKVVRETGPLIDNCTSPSIENMIATLTYDLPGGTEVPDNGQWSTMDDFLLESASLNADWDVNEWDALFQNVEGTDMY